MSFPPSILSPMNHETPGHGTVVESRETVEAITCASQPLDVGCSMLDVGCFPTGSEVPPPFDDLRATQARAALIQFTKTFFGLA